MAGAVFDLLKVRPLFNSSALVSPLPTVTEFVAFNVPVLTASRPVKVLASLIFKVSPLATTPMLLSVNLLVSVCPPLIFKVSPSFLVTAVPVSPAKVSGTCDKPCKSLTVAAEFDLLVLAFPRRVIKVEFACSLFSASAMADLTLVIS